MSLRTRRSLRTLLGLGLLILVLVAPVVAHRSLPGSDFERNALLLAWWKKDPDHYARLRTNFRRLESMPQARREQLRKLDVQLHALDAESQHRLWDVGERYHDWLERLPERDRNRIRSASREEKLTIIRQLREREWIRRLPYSTQKKLETIPAALRPMEIKRLRVREQRRQNRLRQALKLRNRRGARPIRPRFLEDLPLEVQAFVQTKLKAYLSPVEVRELEDSQGKWPAMVQTLVELSQRNPVLPPTNQMRPVLRYLDLPPQLRQVLPRRQIEMEQLDRLRKTEGKWPDFALAFTKLVEKSGKELPFQLGASKPEEFSDEIQTYLRDELEPTLRRDEREKLKNLVGKWPEYPLALHELAIKHRLPIPEMSLPGPTLLWTRQSSVLPEVPNHVLLTFALQELTPKERAKLRLSIDDLGSRERLKEAYFERNPHKLLRPGANPKNRPKARPRLPKRPPSE